MDCVCLTAKVPIFIRIPVKNSWEFQGLTQVVAIADPYHFERNALYIGRGVTMLSRAGIFRASGGIAVDMNSRVFKLPSFYGMIFSTSIFLLLHVSFSCPAYNIYFICDFNDANLFFWKKCSLSFFDYPSSWCSI